MHAVKQNRAEDMVGAAASLYVAKRVFIGLLVLAAIALAGLLVALPLFRNLLSTH